MFERMTPPIDVENMHKRMEAKRDLGDALLDLMLHTVVPDDRKAELEIMKEYSNITRSAQALVESFAINTPKDLTPELIEMQKAVRDYMATVAEGLKQYHDEAVKLKER